MMGHSFTTPYIYEGLGFAGLGSYVTCAEDEDYESEGCVGLVICVDRNTSWYQILQAIFPMENFFLLDSTADYFPAFIAGSCNVLAGEGRVWKMSTPL